MGMDHNGAIDACECEDCQRRRRGWLDELERLEREATEAPWTRRPSVFDDWGMVRGGDHLPVLSTAVGFLGGLTPSRPGPRWTRLPSSLPCSGRDF